MAVPSSIDGVLDITLHHANDIHNICIYGKQDVYAKFSITQAQDTVYSTQPVRGGGKNPVFNQSLQILLSKLDAVLKCELWMMSCARSYLEDQLLGFVLVPLGQLLSAGRTTRDYALSSTELFHTHAGTVCLSLMFYQRGAEPIAQISMMERQSADGMALENANHRMVKGHTSNIHHNVVEGDNHSMGENANHGMVDHGMGESTNHGVVDHGMSESADHGRVVVPADYANIEFPDLEVASENQHLVSMYFDLASKNVKMDDGLCVGGDSRVMGDMRKAIEGDVYSRKSVLQLNSFPPIKDADCDMVLENGEEEHDAWNGSFAVSGTNNSGNLAEADLSTSTVSIDIAQTGTSAGSDNEVSDLNSSKSSADVHVTSTMHPFACNNGSKQNTPSPQSSSGGGLPSSSDEKPMNSSDGQESPSSLTRTPLVSISLDAEEPVVQQQIMDMYVKSMQQFTESLANMKLPFDLDITHSGDAERKAETQSLAEKKNAPSNLLVKDGHKVFYGSRAFF